MEKEGLNR